AHPDHEVELGPAGESVVRGVEDDQTQLALLDVLFERLLKLGRPGRAVVVADDRLILAKVGRKGKRVRDVPRLVVLLQVGRDVHPELAGVFQELLEDRRGGPPVVIVLAVNDQELDLAGWTVRGNRNPRFLATGGRLTQAERYDRAKPASAKPNAGE